MSTVYSRIIEHEKINPSFVFNTKGFQIVGLLCVEEWKSQGGSISQLDIIQQNENRGVFNVFQYPSAFIPTIDQIIEKYVQRVVQKGINKKLHEKRLHEKPKTQPKRQNKTKSVPTSFPPPSHRKRKRIPTGDPIFSGRKFK